MNPAATKECPFCAETIKAAAVLCRFCGRDLLPHHATALSAPMQRSVLPGEPLVTTPIQKSEVFDLLAALIEKSLVVYEEDEQGRGRYRLLETVRQYSRDRLLESQEGVVVRDRHLTLFLQVAEETRSRMPGPEELECLERLATEHDNLRAALEWSVAAAEPEIGLRLAIALDFFWFLHVHRREGVQWLEQLLALPPSTPSIVRARALDAIVILTNHGAGTADPVRQWLEESLAMSQELGYDLGIASALQKLAYFPESYEARLALAEQSVALTRATGDRPALMDALAWSAPLIDRRRDPERLRAVAEEMMEISRELGSIFGTAMAYRAMRWVAKNEGDLPRVRRYLGEELSRIVPLKDWIGVHGALWALADLAGQQGEYPWAARLLGIREVLEETTGLGTLENRLEARDRLVTQSGASIEQALAAAYAEGRAMSLQQAIDYSFEGEEERV